jgi:hypothetical protein
LNPTKTSNSFDERPVKALSLFGVFNPIFCFFMLFMFYINFMVSTSWIDSQDWLVDFAYSVRNFLVSIYYPLDILAHAKTTRFLNVALVNSALVWISLPLFGILNLILVAFNARKWGAFNWPGSPPNVLKYALLGFPFFTLVLLFAMIIPGKESYFASSDLRSPGLSSELKMSFVFGWNCFLHSWFITCVVSFYRARGKL